MKRLDRGSVKVFVSFPDDVTVESLFKSTIIV